MKNLYKCSLLPFAFFCFLLSSCGKQSESTQGDTNGDAPKKELQKLVLLMDWYPQPEHGGFYQALAKGFYKERGLDVEIRPGGGIRDVRPLVALGQVDIAVGTSDTTLIGVSRGLPLVSLAPYFQHDPQCVMFHPELGIKTLKDLDNKVVMMQASLSHAEYMTKILGLTLNMIPLDYSISRFASDKSFVQQCFLTSEPVHLAAQGIHAEVIPLSESGFDPYRHTYTSEKFIQNSPEIVKAFVEASVRGWNDFITGDPGPGLDAIAEANPQQKRELMLLALEEMKKYKLVEGFAEKGEKSGTYQIKRLEEQIAALKELELIDPSKDYMSSFATELLPENYQ